MNNPHVRIGKISYINASPVYYGLDHGLKPDWLEMIPEVPSVLNHQLNTGVISVSPISAAFYAMNHQNLLLMPDLSISCHGPVMSVLLASNHAIEDLDNKVVMFSRESASAAAFLKMIFHQKKIAPIYQVVDVSDFNRISRRADAVLVIGDAALQQPWDRRFTYCLDLGQLWYEMTQLPFVFAVWAVRRPFAKKYPDLTASVHQLLLASKRQGYENLDQVIFQGAQKLGLEQSVIARYFDRLYCDLDDLKIKAMARFFDSLHEQGVLPEKAGIEFFTA